MARSEQTDKPPVDKPPVTDPPAAEVPRDWSDPQQVWDSPMCQALARTIDARAPRGEDGILRPSSWSKRDLSNDVPGLQMLEGFCIGIAAEFKALTTK